MHLDVSAHDLHGSSSPVRLKGAPDICPLCHRSIHPIHIYVILLRERGLCQSVYRCTHYKCQEIFIGTYEATNATEDSRDLFELTHIAPSNPDKSSFSEIIKETSPTFVQIHNQVLAAESIDLSQLVGIGLRKALEFLIKDFAIS